MQPGGKRAARSQIEFSDRLLEPHTGIRGRDRLNRQSTVAEAESHLSKRKKQREG